MKTKMQLVLGENTLETNEFTENECLDLFIASQKKMACI